VGPEAESSCSRFTYFMFYLVKVSPIARVTSIQLFPNYYVGYHTMKAFLRDYWTVYYEGDSQCYNINNNHIRLGLFLLLKTNLLEENVVNAQFSHVTRYKISYVFYIFLSKNLKIRFSDHFFSGTGSRVGVLFEKIFSFFKIITFDMYTFL
jgi:hypothetical protein